MKLAHYQILAPLGAGGMGEVYRARDARLERDVAIKVLPEHLASSAEALARFEREAKALAAVSHPSLVAIFIAELARNRALRVVSRTTVMQFKDSRSPLGRIARALAADAIVEGSLLLTGSSVRITAQLIRADTDEHLWAESYQREVRDVLALQSESRGQLPRRSKRCSSTRSIAPSRGVSWRR